MVSPAGTYRLQLGPDCTFDGAAGLMGYLADLGVSHAYLSPVLQAAPGSTHGYDVTDPTAVSAELGGTEAFARMVAAARGDRIGLLLDIVPNHVSTDPANPWWWDVLAHGRASPAARLFDVDWDPPEPKLRDRLLLPVLGDHFG
ncbi:MAG: alpha-amylase family glycosyl hydrolase, partial [Nocardioidaceae bacterium]